MCAADDGWFLEKLECIRWQGRPKCPYCGSQRNAAISGEHRYRCYGCRAAFSATVGTLFHQSRLPLKTWFEAVYLMEESTPDPSTRTLAGTLGVNKNTACYIAMRIRRARTKESGLIWAIREEMRNLLSTTK
jgi:transposase-like protein